MDDILRVQNLVMPLVWLFGSLFAAMILYWTSKAFLDVDQAFGIPIKKLRLGGSVVIFIVVFLALWKTTTYDTVPVSPEQLRQVQQAVVDLDNTLPLLDSCIDSGMLDGAPCQVAYGQYKASVARLKVEVNQLPLPKNGT